MGKEQAGEALCLQARLCAGWPEKLSKQVMRMGTHFMCFEGPPFRATGIHLA